MKKVILLGLSVAFSIGLSAQTPQVYSTKAGDTTASKISFESKTPVEDIFAETKTAKAAVVVKTKRVKIKIKMISFKFEKPLMEEHFNEKYVETEKYPNAIFDGTIQEDIDFSKDGTYQVSVKGKLTVHGVTKERTLTGTIVVAGGKLDLKTEFKINLVDHKIKVPSVVTKNIAETIDVKAHFICTPYKKS